MTKSRQSISYVYKPFNPPSGQMLYRFECTLNIKVSHEGKSTAGLVIVSTTHSHVVLIRTTSGGMCWPPAEPQPPIKLLGGNENQRILHSSSPSKSGCITFFHWKEDPDCVCSEAPRACAPCITRIVPERAHASHILERSLSPIPGRKPHQ
jgi:hypothetical protein